MRITINCFILAISFVGLSQTPCDGGFASGFPCDNFDLQDRLTPEDMGASFANDSWGWTDPLDGKEYALIGVNNGTVFVDISDPFNIIYLGKLPTHTDSSTWRDIKVYNNHAFIVSEAPGHGMQVFDLTKLRNVENPPITFTEDAHYGEFGSAHNIVINEDTGYAYAVGTSTFAGGPHFVNIQDPINPTAAGGWSGDGYSHDAQVVTYNGPDATYAGRELYLGSNTDEVVIVDVTDKNNPQHISAATYSDVGYTHQGWLTEDHAYFLAGDEFDEFNVGFNTRTVVIDMTDLDNPVQFFDYFGPTPAVDHNGYVSGDVFYLANYNAGMRAIDVSDIANQNMTEIGYFDTVPSNDSPGFGGSWSVYPFFESGNIVISGDAGFTLAAEPTTLNVDAPMIGDFILYPNPAKGLVTVRSATEVLNSIEIYNVLGQKVYQKNEIDALTIKIPLNRLSSGMYIVKINETTNKRLIVN